MDRLNKAKLDPLPMYDTDKIIVILKREEKAVPEREDETDDEYRKKIIDVGSVLLYIVIRLLCTYMIVGLLQAFKCLI